MKQLYWFLLVFSAILYPLPFFYPGQLWWLIFIFPVPLLYLTRTQDLSFIHGFVWACITVSLHTSGGVCVIALLARQLWSVGILLGFSMVLLQSLVAGFLFWLTSCVVREFSVHNAARLVVWSGALWSFIMWIDWYSLSIFGIQEGYPLMHPLIVVGQYPALLILLPVLGKSLMTVFFLCVPASIVALMWEPQLKAGIICLFIILSWVCCGYCGVYNGNKPAWAHAIKSLPYMSVSHAQVPTAVIYAVRNECKKIIDEYPATDLIVMPESAFSATVFYEKPELMTLWNEQGIGKPLHLIFGAFRVCEDSYYNTAHWVYNGVIQKYYDKQHTMLITERLSWLSISNSLQDIYRGDSHCIVRATLPREVLPVSADIAIVPYICSELFFNEYPDDEYKATPILAIVNDFLFMRSKWSTYINQLLVLVARYKAIQWQRDIVYISYTHALFIGKTGIMCEINE